MNDVGIYDLMAQLEEASETASGQRFVADQWNAMVAVLRGRFPEPPPGSVKVRIAVSCSTRGDGIGVVPIGPNASEEDCIRRAGPPGDTNRGIVEAWIPPGYPVPAVRGSIQ